MVPRVKHAVSAGTEHPHRLEMSYMNQMSDDR